MPTSSLIKDCDRVTCSLEEVEVLDLNGLSGSLRPGSESNSFNLSNRNTCIKVIAGVPLGNSVLLISRDIFLVGKDGPQGLDLPVWVVLSSNDSVLVEIVLIRDGNVLRYVLIQAVSNVDLDLRNELLDSGLNCAPVLLLNGLDESVAGVSHVLVWFPALAHKSTDVSAVETEHHTGLEVGRGGIGNGSIVSEPNGVGGSLEHFYLVFLKLL